MRGRVRRLRHVAASTPGRFSVIAVVLVLVAMASGLVGVLTVQHRSDLVSDVGDRSGPLSFQAQSIYRSLSDADATAANAFLGGGVEPVALRQRYADDIAQATAALTASLRITDDRAATQLLVLSDRLPVYTGLIETARAYNRQGIPLGAAYLREASGLMRQSLLPAARQLFETQSEQLAGTQHAAVAFPWAVLLLGLLLLAGLVAAQVFVSRRTKRMVNLGMAVATIAAVTSLLWVTLAVTGATGRIDAGRRDGSAQLHLLAELRVAALQARADESLTLIARGDGAGFEKDFAVQAERLLGKDGSGGLLDRAAAGAPTTDDRRRVEQARAAAQQWLSAHRALRKLDDDGKYVNAVNLAIDSRRVDGPSIAFGRLDAALTTGITSSNATFDGRTQQAAGILAGVNAAIIVLTGLQVAGSVVGLQRRIREYL